MNNLDEKRFLDWARKMRAEIESLTYEKAKTATDVEIVEMLYGFKVYDQNNEFKVGDIYREPETDRPIRCAIAYNGAEHADWTYKTPTLFFYLHGVSPETAFPYTPATNAVDMWKVGEYCTYTGEYATFDSFGEDFRDKIITPVADTVYSPDVRPTDWKIVEVE